MRVARVLLAACAVGAIAAAAAPAQTEEPDQVYLEAEELVENRAQGLYVARGAVRLVAGDRVLYADELTYDPALGRVSARGSVRLFEGQQPAQFADEIILDDDMVEGVAYGFASLLENSGRAAAAAALRRPDGSVELREAYYTACELCEEGGAPTWRLRADRVVRDLDDEVIRYRNMRMEVHGVPVFYAPYFAHADPAAKRRSGFLLPAVDISNRLGFSYQQPYYWAISPYQDLVISPRVMSEANPLIELDYRRRFYSGEVNVEFSYTHEQEFVDGPDADSEGEWSGDYEFRGHIFAEGLFDIRPGWRWGFGVQAADDALFLRRYDYSERPLETNALFQFDQRTLISQIFAAGRGERYYTDLSTVRFQLLNQNFDNDRLPYVAPLLRFQGEAPLPEGFGDLDFSASAVNLRRELGEDHMRGSLGFEWTSPRILPGGVRTEAFALGRIDAYSFNTVDGDGAEVDSTDFTRVLGAAGVDVSWPFLRPGARFNTILAPRAFLAAASGLDDDEVPRPAENVTLDLNQNNLFLANRVGGADIWEEGTRLDLGASSVFDAEGPNPLRVEAFVGRSYRLEGEPRLSEASGVFEDESDWVAEFSAVSRFARLGARTRIDTETGDVNRLDVSAGLAAWRLNGAATYTDIADPAAFAQLREFRARAQVDVIGNWSLTWDIIRDLDDSVTRATAAGIRYRDECTDFRIYWQREDLEIGDLGPSESIKFEFILFTLGGIEQNRNIVRPIPF